jgi:ribosomal protein L7/L12
MNEREPDPDGLPADVLAALQRGDATDAIMLLSQATGLSLKEAKDVIAEHVRGTLARMAPPPPGGALMPAIAAALQRGNKLEAIKLLRETGLRLKEAKDAVEASRDDPRAPHKRSLGEQPKGASSTWWFVLIVVAVLVGFYLTRHLG